MLILYYYKKYRIQKYYNREIFDKEMSISMTNKELSNLYHLKKEIEMQRKRLYELETIAKSCSVRITGMPHGTEISDKVGKYASQIADLNLKKCFFELGRLTEYVQSVDDPLARQIITYRYIHGFSWQKTAYSIGGNNSPYNLKMRLYRYLKNH